MTRHLDRQASLQNGMIRCKYTYNKELVAALENIPMRVYSPIERCFDIPLSSDNFQRLERWSFHFDHGLKKMFVADTKRASIRIPADFRTPNWKVMFPYQREGVYLTVKRKGRTLLADEMGLGKTLQCIEYVNYRKKFPCVVAAPGCLKLNWVDEFKTWAPKVKVLCLEGRNKGHSMGKLNHKRHPFTGYDVVVVNYEILAAWLPTILAWKPLMCIYDEGHRLKNDGAQRTTAAKTLAAACKRIIIATGTPVENNPMDVFNLVQMIDPSIFKSRYQFGIRFCNPSEGWTGDIQFKGCSNAEELHRILSETVMIRRRKEDVLKDLPEKLFSVVHIPMSAKDWAEYKQLHNGILDDLEKGVTQITGMAKLEKMKQFLVRVKLKPVAEWVDEYLTNGKKFVLFCTHHDAVDAFVTHFGGRCVQIDGRVPNDKRMRAMKAFQEDPKIMVLVGNVQAAGTGWTLTAASGCGLVEYPWKPAEVNQAVARLHRIGQRDCVNAYMFACAKTVDEDNIQLLCLKQTSADAVIDGKATSDQLIYEDLVARLKAHGKLV